MTFGEKYEKVILEMKDYLSKNNLNEIKYSYESGWTFKLSIPKTKFQAEQWEAQKRRMEK